MARRPVRGERQPWTPVPEDAIPAAPSPGAQTQMPGTGRPTRVPPQADTTPVVTSMKPPRPGLQPEPYAVSNVYLERERLNTLRVTNPGYYDRIVSELRATDLLGPNANSESAIDEAYRKLLKAAAGSAAEGMPVTPQQARNIIAGISQADTDTGADGRGRTAAYAGPRTTTSVSVTDRADVERTLNTFAVDMLGRNLTDKELKKYTADYREQEMGSPQVTTTTPRGQAATTSVTEQTVSRETIAQNILQDNPMFADNVIKTDVLDMFFNRLGGASSGS